MRINIAIVIFSTGIFMLQLWEFLWFFIRSIFYIFHLIFKASVDLFTHRAADFEDVTPEPVPLVAAEGRAGTRAVVVAVPYFAPQKRV
jgi:hypothetical protein